MNDFSQAVQTVAVYAIPVLFAISLHEAAHGYVARYFGDPTASEQGRLSLNPARHIDPFGTFLLPLMLYLTIQMPFGYAKPVPVDYGKLRNPKKQMGFVAAAGPAANFVMGLGWTIVFVLLHSAQVTEPFLLGMARAGITTNAVMCVFNLIPVPPLDGGRIVTSMLPNNLARPFARIELYGPYVFIGLLILMYTGILSSLLGNLVNLLVTLFAVLVLPLNLLLN
ncbi:MAG: site-2 protease family protein [Pseudomonadota bacterium]